VIEPGWDRYVRWVPGTDALLYARHDAGWNVWRLDLRTGTETKLTEDGDDRSPSPSPDGGWIAWQRGRAPAGVWLMRADGTERRQLSGRGHRDDLPAWSPDGRALVFGHLEPASDESVRAELWSIDVASGEERLLLEGGSAAVFTRDGRWIVFETVREGDDDLGRVRPDGSGYENLTRSAARERHPLLSPDGAFVACLAIEDGGRALDVLALDGSERRRVCALEGALSRPLAWSPDGTLLLVSTGERGAETLAMVALADKSVVPLATGGITVADWR
jgi:Tol biopolymer transport system component